MKKLLVFILILLPLLINAQSKRSLLKLKDGTEIKGILSISSWRSGKARSLGYKDTSESVEDNSERARKYYKHIIRPLQKKIEKGHLSKSWIEDFTVK
jgi:hypothetical protein